MQTDRQTDRQTDTNEAAAFHNFANALKNCIISHNIAHNIMCSFFPFTYCFYMRPDDDSGIRMKHTAQ